MGLLRHRSGEGIRPLRPSTEQQQACHLHPPEAERTAPGQVKITTRDPPPGRPHPAMPLSCSSGAYPRIRERTEIRHMRPAHPPGQHQARKDRMSPAPPPSPKRRVRRSQVYSLRAARSSMDRLVILRRVDSQEKSAPRARLSLPISPRWTERQRGALRGCPPPTPPAKKVTCRNRQHLRQAGYPMSSPMPYPLPSPMASLLPGTRSRPRAPCRRARADGGRPIPRSPPRRGAEHGGCASRASVASGIPGVLPSGVQFVRQCEGFHDPKGAA